MLNVLESFGVRLNSIEAYIHDGIQPDEVNDDANVQANLIEAASIVGYDR